MSYMMHFYSGIGNQFKPEITIVKPIHADTICDLRIGEFSFPLTKQMALDLHTEVGTILTGILFPITEESFLPINSREESEAAGFIP